LLFMFAALLPFVVIPNERSEEESLFMREFRQHHPQQPRLLGCRSFQLRQDRRSAVILSEAKYDSPSLAFRAMNLSSLVRAPTSLLVTVSDNPQPWG
jgi:hypothetical protein